MEEVKNMMREEEEIRELLHQGEILQIEQMLKDIKNGTVALAVLQCLIKIFRNEVRFGEFLTVFDYSLELEELKKHFVKVKLLLRRLEFDFSRTEQMELYDYCAKTGVSKYFLSQIILNNIFFQEKVCIRIIHIYREKEGMNSEKAQYFTDLLGTLRRGRHG